MKIKLDTSQEGLEAVVGTLEARILSVLWDDPRAYMTNKQIHREVNHRGHLITLTAITTTTRRMTTKGMLKETTPHKLYVYEPVLSQGDLIECVIQRVLGTLILSWPEVLESYIEGITRGKELYYGARFSQGLRSDDS